MKIEVNLVVDEWYPVYSLDYWFPVEPNNRLKIEYEEFLTAMIFENLRMEANEYIKGLCPKSS
jgi:hypothetical protein